MELLNYDAEMDFTAHDDEEDDDCDEDEEEDGAKSDSNDDDEVYEDDFDVEEEEEVEESKKASVKISDPQSIPASKPRDEKPQEGMNIFSKMHLCRHLAIFLS